MDPVFMAVLIVIGVLVFAAIWIFSYLAEQKRKAALRALAARLGLVFSYAHNYELAVQCGFLNKLAQGDNRYFFNSFSGTYRDRQVLVSDYHYETHSTDSKGNRQTNHHYLAVFILQLPLAFPELTIVREGFLSKIAQAFGYEDIDFESAEFSRAFCVRSRDKKFAYDVCNAQMMEYLLANRDLSVEIERNALALVFEGQMDIERLETDLNRLLEIRARLPNYLFERT